MKMVGCINFLPSGLSINLDSVLMLFISLDVSFYVQQIPLLEVRF